MDVSQRSEMLGGMPVKKLLFSLAIPAMIAMMANALYNLVDTIFVAWGAGEVAIGALSIVFPIQMIVIAFGLMIGIGSASVFSRAYGRGDEDTMKKVVMAAITINLVVSLTMTVGGLIFIEPLLRLFGATASNIDYARDYMVYILWSLVPFSGAIVLNNLTRAEGRPKVAMISLLIGALLNIILDPIFIFDFNFLGLRGLNMGVEGAALATLIAKTASFIYVFAMALSKHSALNIDLRYWYRMDLKLTIETFIVGFPTFLRNTLGAFLVIIINNLINLYATGDPAIYISIYGVINRLIMFLLLPGFGLVQGLQPIVGFNFGAEKYDRLKDVLRFSMQLITGYFFVMFILTLGLAEPLFRLFSRDADAFFIREGARAIRIIAIGFTLIGYQIVMSAVYQAMGYAFRALLIALLRQFILFIPLALLLTWWLGIEGVWLTFLVSDITAGVISYFVYRYELRSLQVMMQPA